MRKSLVLILIVLGLSGCFDGERGVLTELLIHPAPPPQFALPTKIPAGTGSELVMSPIPERVEKHLYGRSWEEAVDRVEFLLEHPNAQQLDFWGFCEQDVYRRMFYDKYIDADGIAIIGPSEHTSGEPIADEFLYAAREVILVMTSKRPGLREVLSLGHEMGFRYVLMGADIWGELNRPHELTLSLASGFFLPVRGRALAFGGIYFYWHTPEGLPAYSEEVFDTRTVAHEMAHAIDYVFDWYPHLFPNWGARLTAAYEAAMEKAQADPHNSYFRAGEWPLENEEEFWAVGANDWFTFRGDDERRWMLNSNPLLYALLDEVFPVANFPVTIKIVEALGDSDEE